MISKVAIIIERPWGDERAVIGIRTAHALQTGGFETILALTGPGIFNLIGRRPSYLQNLLQVLVENDGKICCLAEDLDRLGVNSGELALPTEVVDAEGLADLLEDADSINIF